MSKIFISHSSQNNAQALAVAQWLEKNGWDDYFLDISLERGLRAGDKWQDALNAAADRCEAVIFLISSEWLESKWCFAEFVLASKKYGKQIFAVIVTPTKFDAIPNEIASEFQVCDLVEGVEQQIFQVERDQIVPKTNVVFSNAGLDELKLGLKKSGLDPTTFSWPPASDKKRSPYRGLAPLEKEDAAVYFGREAKILRALDTLRGIRSRNVGGLFVILGASGSGKSSFLRAGLWRRIERDDRHFLPLPIIRPERAVINGQEGLLASLEQAFEKQGIPQTRSQIRSTLADGKQFSQLLHELQKSALRKLGEKVEPPPVLFFVDQGEELFIPDGKAEAEQFLTLIGNLLNSSSTSNGQSEQKKFQPIVVITIRSDSYQMLQACPQLSHVKQTIFDLPPLSQAEYKMVIEGPAKRSTEAKKELHIDPRLTEQLLHDAEGADALPLLAFTLERLFIEHGGDGNLTLQEYKDLGGIQGSVEAAVEAAFANPDAVPVIDRDSEKREEHLRNGFIPWLARIDPETETRKRRVAEWEKIPEKAQPLLERLITARLLVRDQRHVDGKEEKTKVVEVAHEALLRQWPTLTQWLDDAWEELKTADKVKKEAGEWIRNNRGDAWLTHEGERLSTAANLLNKKDLNELLGQVGRDYIQACQAKEKAKLDKEKAHQEERERQLKQIEDEQKQRALEQKRTKKSQRRNALLLGLLLLGIISVGILIVLQTRDVGQQASRVLAAAARDANEKELYDRASRLGILATRESWLNPAVAEAEAHLAAAANQLQLIVEVRKNMGGIWDARFSRDGNRVLTVLQDRIPQVWDAATGDPLGTPLLHAGPLGRVVFSPNGRTVLTVLGDHKTARIWDVATGGPVGARLPHTSALADVIFSPNGKMVLTVSEDRRARLWNAVTGDLIGDLLSKAGTVWIARFSRNGNRVLTVAPNGTAQVWETGTGEPVGKSFYHAGGLWSVRLGPNGRRVLVVPDDLKTAQVWNVAVGVPKGVPLRHSSSVEDAKFSPDGLRVLTVAKDGAVQVWDAITGAHLVGPVPHTPPVWIVEFSRDWKRVLTVAGDDKIKVWETATGEYVGHYSFRNAPTVRRASLSPDGTRVLTVSKDDKAAWVWDVVTGNPIIGPLRHGGGVLSAVFSPDGQRALTLELGRSARVWNLTTIAPLPQTSGVKSARFSRNGKRVLTVSQDKTVRVWEAGTGKPVSKTLSYPGGFWNVGISPDGTLVVTVAQDGKTQVWDVATSKPLGTPLAHDGAVKHATFSPDGKWLFTISRDMMRMWDASTREPVGHPFQHTNVLRNGRISSDGRRVLTISDDDKMVWLWDLDAGDHALRGAGIVKRATFSPDGQQVLTVAEDGTVQLWDAISGNAIGHRLRHDGAVNSATFSSDGQQVLTVAEDGTVQLWDAISEDAIGHRLRHDGPVKTSMFSRDGQKVLTVSKDGSVQVWDAISGDAIGHRLRHDGPVKNCNVQSRWATGTHDHTQLDSADLGC